MPGTPSVREDVVATDVDAAVFMHSSCPPEDDRDDSWIQSQIRLNVEEAESAVSATSLPTPPRTSTEQDSTPDDTPVPSPHTKMDIELDSKPDGMTSPVSIDSDSKPETDSTEVNTPSNAPPMALHSYAGDSSSSESTMDYEFSSVRLLPSYPSSFLRPGTRFTGVQQSEKQTYHVQVDVKMVDMRESYMCGFLKIEGLTDDHPTLTTFFEGEIIGTKHTFHTKHPDWGADLEHDLTHWQRFPNFKANYEAAFENGNYKVYDAAQKPFIFMRWKEHFLVPDHRVRTINGASFEGFYYIAFDQVNGSISGTYFHSKSEKYQRLELTRVEDRGCLPCIELR